MKHFHNVFTISGSLRFAVILIFIASANYLQSQTSIYTESFATDGEGIAGACTGMAISTCATNVAASNLQWTITGDASALEVGDFVQTAGGSLVARHLSNELCFRSSMIDISGHENISMMVDLREESDLELADYVDVSYILDGTSTLIIDFNGQGNANHTLVGVNSRDPIIDAEWQSVSIQESIGNGNILEVEICFDNNTDNEAYFLDQVIVKGERKEVAEDIPTMGQWSLFILALLFLSLGLVFLKRIELGNAQYRHSTKIV